MSSVRARADNGLLFFDFRYQGSRFREQTTLKDTLANRKRMEKVLEQMEEAIKAGTFVYEHHFPNSKALKRLRVKVGQEPQATQEAVVPPPPQSVGREVTGRQEERNENRTPLFEDFANQWVDEHSIQWRRSHIRSLMSTLNGRILPYFGKKVVGSITKSDVLAFRAALAKEPGRGDRAGLSPKRINEIVGTLCQILDEAADRFQFTSPTTNIKRLKVRKTDVHPFSLHDVQRILATVRADYKNYFMVRFFTGMRTGEVHGVKWKYVDFERRLILVRETFVLGEDEYTKTDGSQRDIQMSQPVYEALLAQHEATGALSEYVFCNMLGAPLDNKNFSDRVWYPLLRYLDLEERRPYQMRHTAATLWLAAGEAPEWIARQLGHTSTEMLFRVYSRYVPNLTRQDGSAMERLLASKLSHGPLVKLRQPDGIDRMGPADAAVYVPVAEVPPQAVPRMRGRVAAERRARNLENGPGSAKTARATSVRHG